MIVCDKPHAHLIKIDGSLWHGPSGMVSDLEKLGWRQIINPKRTYYPEFDRTSANYREPNAEVVEEDTLEGELL